MTGNLGKSFLLCILAMVIGGCGASTDSTAQEQNKVEPPRTSMSYQALQDSDLQAVRDYLLAKELLISDVSQVSSYQFLSQGGINKTIETYGYQLNGAQAYGVIIYPDVAVSKDTPVALMLSGLNQEDPQLYVESLFDMFQSFSNVMDDMLVLVPSYRGNILKTDGNYKSAGDFCDAYEGATDDSLAFLNLAEDIVAEIDTDKVLAMGWSRGGLLAHLLGQRDDRIAMAITVSAPTDFYRQSVANHYSQQYICQFVRNKSEQESKQRALASSPLHFAQYSAMTLIHHGGGDSVVPSWNASEMEAGLTANAIDNRLYLYPEANHGLRGAPCMPPLYLCKLWLSVVIPNLPTFRLCIPPRAYYP